MPRANESTILSALEARDRLLRCVREFFWERGFLEVETPTIVPSPGLDPHLTAFEVVDDKGVRAGWLATSPEYHMKRLLCAGAERIFQVTRSYRVDERGSQHEREFTMLEWYRAHTGSEAIIQDTIELVERCAEEIAGSTDLIRNGAKVAFAGPWKRLTVKQALEMYTEISMPRSIEDEDRFFQAWAEQVQPRLGWERPVIVDDWPSSMASLAKLKENGTADRFEAFVRGIELCNGFGELTDPLEQRRRFERDQELRQQRKRPVYPIDERFLTAMASGMPESGGNALGLDRLLSLLLGGDSIQCVMCFPERNV